MAKNYVTGFPRIGEKRELKVVLEKFWAKECLFKEVEEVASMLKKRHWDYQKKAGIDYISSNDFSLYDNMLDTAVMLNAIPQRFRGLEAEELYFTMARGDEKRVAMEMTKWFNTNYHYIVPELSLEDEYKLNSSKIINEYNEAKGEGIKTKINIIGPFTFLGLSKRVDGGNSFELLERILPVYEELLKEISVLDDGIIVQIDEPIFVKECEVGLLGLIKPAYKSLAESADNIKIIAATYFEHSKEAVQILSDTPIYGLALDFTIWGEEP